MKIGDKVVVENNIEMLFGEGLATRRLGKHAVVIQLFKNTGGRELAAIEFDDGYCHCVLTKFLIKQD